MTTQRILILCTGNSCRSQLAEALVNHDFAGRWEAVSAGTRPAGYVHALAVRALAELGIDHAGTSKQVDVFRGQPFDLVLTVCDSANEDCPVWLGSGRRVHIGFPDPAAAQGDEAAVFQVFRDVRDDIRARLATLLTEQP